MNPKFKLAPSILSADFADLKSALNICKEGGADWVHVDVMDNQFVPNLTMGPIVCESLIKHGIEAPIDVHLMVRPVDALIKMFAKAGATYITFHREASENIKMSLDLVRDLDCKTGLVLNPQTKFETIEPVLEELDMLVLMSVNPGFGGQSFIDSTYEKITQARTLIDHKGLDIRLEVDGGITENNISKVADCGADTFVAGSAIFSKPNYKTIIDEFRDKLVSSKD